MPVITRLELENAQRDATDLGKIVGGAATLANPGHPVGTVTTRLGETVPTLAKVVSDGVALVEERLEPIIYQSTAERDAALTATGTGEVTPGQTCFDKEAVNLYICVLEADVKTWHPLSDLSKAARADLNDLLLRRSTVGRVSVSDFDFMNGRDRLFDATGLTAHHVSFPGKSTLSEGLAKALNYTSWPTTHHMQEGVDFGCRIAQNDLLNVSNLPDGVVTNGLEWLASTKRIVVRNNNTNEMTALYVPGYVDIQNLYERSVTLRDCIIDTNYEKLQAVAKANGEDFPVFIEYCTLKRFTSEACSPNRGHVAFCSVEYSKGDGFKASGRDVVFHGNMVRLLGQVDPAAHADAIQVWDCIGLELTQNTFYMPGTGTVWDEATFGSTQCLRLITENASNELREVYVAGNIFIGGGFTVAVRSRFTGSLVENVVVANNIIGGTEGGGPFYTYGPVTKEHWSGNSPGTIRNLIFANRMHDGTGFNAEAPGVPQGGTNQNGLWHYSKPHASARFLEIGQRLGLLDWNGDPLVASRTTG